MNHLIKMITKKVQKWYYYQELKDVTILAAGIFSIWFLYKYGRVIIQWIFTEKGLLYISFLLAALVLSITIKIYYRIMVIKYHEKDFGIRLFENAGNAMHE